MKTEIEREFEAQSSKLSEIRAQFTARLVRWVYSIAEIWSWEDRRRKGSDADLLPSADGALYACGFDALGQPIMLRDFGYETKWVPRIVPTKEIWVEEFITHNVDGLGVMRFVHGRLQQLSWMKFAGPSNFFSVNSILLWVAVIISPSC